MDLHITLEQNAKYILTIANKMIYYGMVTAAPFLYGSHMKYHKFSIVVLIHSTH